MADSGWCVSSRWRQFPRQSSCEIRVLPHLREVLAGHERFDSECLDRPEVFGIRGNDSQPVFDGRGGDLRIGELKVMC